MFFCIFRLLFGINADTDTFRSIVNLYIIAANQNMNSGFSIELVDGEIIANMKNCTANKSGQHGFYSAGSVNALKGRLENCSAKDNGNKSFEFESMNNNIQVTENIKIKSAEL
ncbi:MAG: hypothetical protein KAR79_03815 [Simkaniaceae bacterium]|nr:hypothetical protein [Simkaniaceae bacterium]